VAQWGNPRQAEENVRGSDVFVIQSMSDPVHHHLMELLLSSIPCACLGARITAVIPYFAYAKQEKKTSGPRTDFRQAGGEPAYPAGADRILTMDLHSPAIEGFFDIPVDHLRAAPILSRHINRLKLDDLVIVSPDAVAWLVRKTCAGGLVLARHHFQAASRTRCDGSVEMVGDVTVSRPSSSMT
jgi:ribose-phosphate pyrophosphokinase